MAAVLLTMMIQTAKSLRQRSLLQKPPDLPKSRRSSEPTMLKHSWLCTMCVCEPASTFLRSEHFDVRCKPPASGDLSMHSPSGHWPTTTEERRGGKVGVGT